MKLQTGEFPRLGQVPGCFHKNLCVVSQFATIARTRVFLHVAINSIYNIFLHVTSKKQLKKPFLIVGVRLEGNLSKRKNIAYV